MLFVEDYNTLPFRTSSWYSSLVKAISLSLWFSMADSFSIVLPFFTGVHMLQVKLNSMNYLLWCSQFEPLLTPQNLFGHLDGTLSALPTTVCVDSISISNPTFISWRNHDQMLLSLLYSSLIDKAMIEMLGLYSAHAVGLLWRPCFLIALRHGKFK